MMKKTIALALAAVTAAAVLTTTAFAAGTPAEVVFTGSAAQTFASNREANKDFRATALALRDDVKTARSENIDLIAKNRALRQELSGILKNLKQSGAVLDAETAAKLKDDAAQIKTLAESLAATKGAIAAALKESEGFVKNRDYDLLANVFSEISSIQQNRNALLTQINTLLEEMLAVVR